MARRATRRVTTRARRAGAVLLGLLIGVWSGACGRAPGPRNVLLVSIDTLRADHLGCYGFPENTTPSIDALAAEGARFEEVVSPVPLTLPAHSTMLTGTLPTRHGVHDNLGYALGSESTTLAEMLREEGFATGAVVSSFVLDSRFNLSQGFDSYNDDFEEVHKIALLNERKGDETTDFALRFLEEHRDDRFFLFVHYYDPHDDYAPPEPFLSRFADDPYAGEVAFADAQVGRVIQRLSKLELLDSTLVVITGDHGEMLGEHGESTHGFFIYPSAVRVPLVFRWPGGIPVRTIPGRVGLVDLLPTIAGLLEIEPPAAVQGRDLSPILRGSDPTPVGRRELYVESMTPSRFYGAQPLFGLFTGDYEYIHARRPELYDLAKDPDEATNVIGEHPEIAAGMRRRLEDVLSEGESQDRGAAADEETRQRLESLGYLSNGSRPARFDLDSEGDDPKDWIAFYARHQLLEKLMNAGELEDARHLAIDMLKEHPDFAAGHLQLAAIATEDGDLPLAREHYEKALALEPANAAAHFNLGNIRAELGDYDGAVESFRSAVALDPDFAEADERLRFSLRAKETGDAPAHARAAADDLTGAEAALRRALATAPDDVEANSRLGTLLAAQSKWAEAVKHFDKALAASPDSAELHHRLALALGETGDAQGALRHLERAAKLAPDSATVESDLAGALKRLRRPGEAVEHYRRAVELDPKLAVAWNDLGSLLGAQGRVTEALESFRHAVAADGSHAVAQNNLGLALRMTGERDEAVPHFERAVALRPDWPVPLRELAWILATHPDSNRRNPKRALQLAQRANELTSKREPVVLDTLAAAYASNGELALAVETAEKAAALAETRMPGLAAEIRSRAELYRRGEPFREAETTRSAPRR